MENDDSPDPGSPDGVSVIVLKCVSLVVLIAAGVLENASMLYTLGRLRAHRRAPYVCLMNICFVLLTRSALVLPMVLASVWHRSRWPWGKATCTAAAFTETFLTFWMLFGLVTAAAERHLAVLHPQTHSQRLQGKRVLGWLAAGWTGALLLATPPVFGLGTYTFQPWEARCTLQHRHHTDNDTLAFLLIATCLAIATLTLYVRIFWFLRAHRKMVPVLCPALRSGNWTFVGQAQLPGFARVITQPTALGLPGQPHIAGRFVNLSARRNEHITRLFVIVTVIFDLFSLPQFVVCIWYVLDASRAVPYVLVTSSAWLMYMQVAVVPLICLVCHPPLRSTIASTATANVVRDMMTEQETTCITNN